MKILPTEISNVAILSLRNNHFMYGGDVHRVSMKLSGSLHKDYFGWINQLPFKNEYGDYFVASIVKKDDKLIPYGPLFNMKLQGGINVAMLPENSELIKHFADIFSTIASKLSPPDLKYIQSKEFLKNVFDFSLVSKYQGKIKDVYEKSLVQSRAGELANLFQEQSQRLNSPVQACSYYNN